MTIYSRYTVSQGSQSCPERAAVDAGVHSNQAGETPVPPVKCNVETLAVSELSCFVEIT